jgi:ketosteroid isomerase-like protein
VKNKGSVAGADEHSTDVRTIQALIARQFGSLSWVPGKLADWEAFAADFHPDAALYPAARPAKSQTVEAFVERMKGLAATRLRSFKETVVGTEVHVFGNVAVALAACEIIENEAGVSRGVEALLLVKEEGRWQIVSQAWDTESEANSRASDRPQGFSLTEVADSAKENAAARPRRREA